MLKSISVNVDPGEENDYMATTIIFYSEPVDGFNVAPTQIKASELDATNLGRFGLIVTTLQTEAAIGGWWIEHVIVEPGPLKYPPFSIPISTDPPLRTLNITLVDYNASGQRARSLNTTDFPTEVADAILAIWDDFN